MTKDAFINLMIDRAKRLKDEDAETQTVDWQARKLWWLNKIDKLYDQITVWIEPLKNAGVVDRITAEKIQLQEETLGGYESSVLKISLGRRVLKIKPVGSVIVGGMGRIDVDGPEGTARFILTTPENVGPENYMESAAWFISNSSNKLSLVRLDEDEFLRLFSLLMGLTQSA